MAHICGACHLVKLYSADIFCHSMLGINRLRLLHVCWCRVGAAPVHGRSSAAAEEEEQHQPSLVTIPEVSRG